MSALHDRIAALPPEKRRLLERRLMAMQSPAPDHAIPRREWSGPAPLSFAQERLWFLDQFQPGSPLYNMPLAFDVAGALDYDALRRALDLLVARHSSLRTTFGFQDGAAFQTVDASMAAEHSSFDVDAADLDSALVAEASRPYDLASSPMLRASLFRCGSGGGALLLNMPHICGDGWSYSVLLRELARLYAGETALPELPIEYRDFAAWQRDRVGGETLDGALAYWKRRLHGYTPFELPLDRRRPPAPAWDGACEMISLSPALSAALAPFSAARFATPFMTLLAAAFVLLHRVTGREDLCVGTPVTNRGRLELEGIVGLFVNTLLVRTGVSPRLSFETLLDQARGAVVEAQQHQDLPFEKVVAALHPERAINRDPYVRVLLSYAGAGDEIDCGGLPLRMRFLDLGAAKFDLRFHFHHGPDQVRVLAEYRRDLFERGTIRRMLEEYAALVEAAVADPRREVGALLDGGHRAPAVSPAPVVDRSYPQVALHAVFEKHARGRPDATALVMGPEKLTYGELNRRANRLARALIAQGAGPESCVGLMLPRSMDAIVAMLGIWKAGAAYVPLDRSYPTGRLGLLASDCRMRLVVADARDFSRAPAGLTPVPVSQRASRESDADPAVATTPDTLACVLYTSGSTGKPKGVEVLHRGIARLLFGVDYARFGPDEVFLHAAPLSFDAATFEIWGALLHGGRCAVLPDGVPAPDDLAAAIRAHGVTTVWLTAALFNLVIDEAPEALAPVRQLLTGGEALSAPHVRRALDRLPGTTLINGYGPTEATTFTCCYRIPRELPPGIASIPIGPAISNTELYILDEQGRPQPPGIAGELFIGGDGVARGYLNDAELTRERFLPNCFTGNGQLYRTGDIVRMLPEGALEFLGRVDDQVKIRGHRIEPGEVEAVLRACPDVRAAAVFVEEAAPGERCLAAYATAREDASPSPASLRQYLEERLPAYMIPARISIVERMPLKPNGKLDRSALSSAPAPQARPAATVDEIETRVAGIWKELLGADTVEPDANFFHLGGHSLMAVQLADRLEKTFGRKLPLVSLFQAPTVRGIAGLLRAGVAAAPARTLVAIQPGGSKPPLFGVHDVRGQVLLFGALSAHFGPDQPVYALQPHGFDGAPFTIEQMAGQYVREIRAVQPSGPYRLAGACFGGVVAFEMARQLEAQNERVEVLALIDAFAPGGLHRLSPIRAFEARCRLFGRRVAVHGRNVLRLPPNDSLRYIVRSCHTLKRRVTYRLWAPRGADSPPASRNLAAAEIAAYWALRRYVPEAYNGNALLFRARERSEFSRDVYAGWSGLIRGGIELCEVPGDHLTMLSHPNRTALAQQLAERLDGRRTVAAAGSGPPPLQNP